jgi:cell division protein FtsQ
MPERDVSRGSGPVASPGPEPRGAEQTGTEPHGREHGDVGGGRPPGPARPARPRRRRKAVLVTLAVAVIVAFAVWALLGSSLLVVRSVTVTGAGAVPRAEVLRAADIAPGTPLIRVDTAAVARRVDRITQVQSAQVSRDWPDTVVIVIQERTPVLAVASGGGFALVDRFGVVVSQVASRPPGMVLLDTAADPSSLRGDPAVQAAVTVLHELPPQIRRQVRAVAAPSPDAVTLDLRQGVTVLWGGTGRAAAKAAELVILMRTKASSYNLSDPYTAVTGG